MRDEMDDVLRHNKRFFIKQLENNWVNGQSTILTNEMLKIYHDLEKKQSGRYIEELVYRMWAGGSIHGNVNEILSDINIHAPNSIIVLGPEEWEIGNQQSDSGSRNVLGLAHTLALPSDRPETGSFPA